MTPSEHREIIKIEASVFDKRIGDSIQKGEVLGTFAGSDVKAPFNGIIDHVSFDPEDHALVVVMVEKS